MKIHRTIKKQIQSRFFQGKVIILYGARQVGKTTLVKEILDEHPKGSVYFNCDEPDVRAAFTEKSSTQLKSFIGNNKLVVIDEAQRVKDIGLTLKLLIDNYPEIQIIATGSSSFELSNKTVEPLTGRHFEFHLYPISTQEMLSHASELEEKRQLERRLIYGMYPEVLMQEGPEAEQRVKSISQSYLFKDILVFREIRNSEALEKLLQALALQLGNEVSFNELSQLIGVDKNTVMQYLQILERAFVVFRLPPFSRNARNELKKLRKVYFYDNGIRNAIINNFNPLHLRNDVGALWENFMISERHKKNVYSGVNVNRFFWRTHSQQEIDYIEESSGKLSAFEFKWKAKKTKAPSLFSKNYPEASFECINQENYLDFLV